MERAPLTPAQTDELLQTLKLRFEKHPKRHPNLDWQQVSLRLVQNPGKLFSLFEMERTGGEPDVTSFDAGTGEYIFTDCSAESPAGRRSLCYDRAALDARKENKPITSAEEMSAQMYAELLSEEQYRDLQRLGEFDLKTSSWVATPADIRSRGGALFCDRRYGRVFTYHNGADSYYAARGFRCALRV